MHAYSQRGGAVRSTFRTAPESGVSGDGGSSETVSGLTVSGRPSAKTRIAPAAARATEMAGGRCFRSRGQGLEMLRPLFFFVASGLPHAAGLPQ